MNRLTKLNPTTRATIVALVGAMASLRSSDPRRKDAKTALDGIATDLGFESKPENFYPLTVAREIFDKRAFFAAQIAPELDRLSQLCAENGIPFVFAAQTAREDDGSEEGYNVISLKKTKNLDFTNPRVDHHFTEIVDLLTDGAEETTHEAPFGEELGGLDAFELFSALFGEGLGGGIFPEGMGETVRPPFTRTGRFNSSAPCGETPLNGSAPTETASVSETKSTTGTNGSSASSAQNLPKKPRRGGRPSVSKSRR